MSSRLFICSRCACYIRVGLSLLLSIACCSNKWSLYLKVIIVILQGASLLFIVFNHTLKCLSLTLTHQTYPPKPCLIILLLQSCLENLMSVYICSFSNPISSPYPYHHKILPLVSSLPVWNVWSNFSVLTTLPLDLCLNIDGWSQICWFSSRNQLIITLGNFMSIVMCVGYACRLAFLRWIL